MATHLQIVCEQAQRFPDPPRDSKSNVDPARAAATALAGNLTAVDTMRAARFFARSWEFTRRVLQPLLEGVESSAQVGVCDELRWLQENTRLLNTALQDTAELAKVKPLPCVRTASAGDPLPRVVAIAEAYLGAVQYRFDTHALEAFLDSLQETTVLDIAELWTLVPSLKLLLLQQVASRAHRLLNNPAGVYGVDDCIRSLHHVGQTSWKNLLEPRILIDGILREDPAGAYPSMDYESRERYWSAVTEIASHSDLSEMEVAIQALSLAQEARNKSDDAEPRVVERRSHVGYYLVAEGASILHQQTGFRPAFGQRIASLLRRYPNAYYLSGIGIITLSLVATVLLLVGNSAARGPLVLAILALLLPCSQIAVELINYLTTLLLRPQLLPKLDFSQGIPDSCATVVAVPALLLNESQVRQLVEHLEVRYLGNRDRNLHFALLTDLPDSRHPASEDDPRVALCAELIKQLNEKHAGEARGSFLLAHRHRVYNPRERKWMGWERKRGKLMDFARLLRHEYDSFPVKVGDLSLLPRVRFVITLDVDTELPRGSAHRMIGAMAHPLNAAILDPQQNIVVSGFGILQPRVAVSVQSAARSRLANILAGERGLDIYTRAVSDVYQDLYSEAIFTGKGIWEVDTLLRTFNNRFPENALLSHDLIEGAHARTGLASDIELIDDYPSHYSAFSRRKHRWTRGDWQLAEWLLPRVPDATGKRIENPLSFDSRWKIFDNLRRSLVEPAAFALLILGWLALPGSALRWTVAAIVLMFAPAWLHVLSPLVLAARKRDLAILRRGLAAFKAGNAALALRLTFLAHQALLCLDAIARVLVRRLVTRQGLLEWETAAEAELRKGHGTVIDRYLSAMPALAAVLALGVFANRHSAVWVAAPVLLLWACSKPISMWLNQPAHTAHYEVSANDRLFLRSVALRTWRYFAELSNEEHNWLVPDNVQQDPPRIADRTSPTDLGLLLNARQVACEMGYLTVPEFAELTGRTLSTVEALPKFHGHLFNWYNTRTLEPLPPRFISSADSGNLVASLWSLGQACRERLHRPLVSRSLLEGFADYVRAINQHSLSGKLSSRPLTRQSNPSNWFLSMQQAAETLPRLNEPAVDSESDLQWLSEEARRRYESVAALLRSHCPWLLPEYASIRDNPALHLNVAGENVALERLPAFIQLLSDRIAAVISTAPAEQQTAYQGLQALLGEARQNSIRLLRDLRAIVGRASQLASHMDFRFLFNRWRKLLSVGFDVDSQQLIPACYDLLASEARLAVFVAIAKEDIPQEAWFLMGRTHGLDNGRPVLLSWTGTMFEYLMPGLWMRSYPNTLLTRAQAEAVRSHQAYASHKHIPWGISESAYARRDDDGNYQYSAFGIPPLALHGTGSDSLVVSPYSTMLALSVDTGAAIRNLRRMAKEGWLDTFGFYDAGDYTPGLRGPSRRPACNLVPCWMAHHQGMSMLAIGNLLCGDVVQRCFHSNPRVQATELLLQEKPVASVGKDGLRRGTAAA
jgi:cyclic beta-1,2-glucan synthetase